MTSKIKVDNINKVSDDSNIIKKCGTTTTIGSGASNPIVVDGSAITLGRCGGTVSIASGATTSGMGRTGTVDWQTGSIKTGTFTAANGEGYFANTSGGAFTMNLPAGSAGAIVSVADYAGSFNSNALTVSPNGTDKIGSVNGDVSLETIGQSVTFVFVDSTQGWVNTMDSTSNVRASAFVCAAVSGVGNTLVTAPDCANVKIATFTGPGNFTVNSTAIVAANNVVSYLVVGGGGGGGAVRGGGAGAGGFREAKSPVTPYTASPLDGSPSAPNLITVSAQTYPIVVGAGGALSTAPTSGSNSSFSTIIGAGGGNGGTQEGSKHPGGNGGSGGGGGGDPSGSVPAGSGNTPPTSPAQGTAGALGNVRVGGGGGGATVAGSAASGPAGNGGPGGAGATTNITSSPVAYAGGGGGGSQSGTKGSGGTGGGGDGGDAPAPACAAQNGTVNTGGGGGGQGDYTVSCSGNGGSGIVVIRYKFNG